MKKPAHSLAFAGAALLAALVAFTPAQAQSADRGPAQAACEVAFQPEMVVVQQRPVTVAADLSEQVSQVTTVAPQDESGLIVESFQERKPSLQPDVVITLDTSGSDAGEWTVTIEGESTTCEGTLIVRNPGADTTTR